MSSINRIAGFLQGSVPVRFIRARLERFGGFIRWLGGYLTMRNQATQDSQIMRKVFASGKRLAQEYTGPMDEAILQNTGAFYNELLRNQQQERQEQFGKDVPRLAFGANQLIFDGRRFDINDHQSKSAYAGFLDSTGRSHTNQEEGTHFANYVRKEVSTMCGNPAAAAFFEASVHQSACMAMYFATLSPAISALHPEYEAQIGMLMLSRGSSSTYPRSVVVTPDRDGDGRICGASLRDETGYTVMSPTQNRVLFHVKVTVELKVEFNADGSLRVTEGQRTTQAIESYTLALQEIQHMQTYFPSVSLIDSIAQWTFWGGNALSLGYLERRSIFPHLDQMEEYIRSNGQAQPKDLRDYIAQLDELYRQTRQERYKQAKLAMVRSLFEQEINSLKDQDVEAKLSTSLTKQSTLLNENNDVSMYVRDNQTRSSAKTHIVFQDTWEDYQSDASYYADTQAGEERSYFVALQAALQRRESAPRHVVQTLLTQSVMLDVTADLFAKTAEAGYAAPSDISGAATVSIVVRADNHVTYTLNTRYALKSRAGEVAGEIAVDAAVDLRFEQDNWVPRIYKRDIRVIGAM